MVLWDFSRNICRCYFLFDEFHMGRSIALWVCLCLGTTAHVSGAVITVLGDAADGTVTVDAFPGDFPLPMIRAGVAGDFVGGQSAIFFFVLPQLSSRSALVDAEIDIQYLGISQFTV